MPVPFILGAFGAAAAAAGIGSGVHGAVKMKKAKDTLKEVEWRHTSNVTKFEKEHDSAAKVMDELGKKELEILRSFKEFSDIIEQIQNRPEFKPYDCEGIKLPEFDKETIQKVSLGAGILLGGIKGAAAGVAGGFAAAGATTSAIMAMGTASTGTAISSLSGAAAVNATLAALGGGSIAAGGGGIALGTTVLSAASFGMSLLIGGVIFNITGSKLSNKAGQSYEQVLEEEKQVTQIGFYLRDLRMAARKYTASLDKVNKKYLEKFGYLFYIVKQLRKTNWEEFTEDEKLITENTALLVALLYKMCKVNLVIKSNNKNNINEVNSKGIDNSINEADKVLQKIA